MDLLQIPVALATAHLGPEEARKQVQTPAKPEQQAAFGATRMCHKSWTIYEN